MPYLYIDGARACYRLLHGRARRRRAHDDARPRRQGWSCRVDPASAHRQTRAATTVAPPTRRPGCIGEDLRPTRWSSSSDHLSDGPPHPVFPAIHQRKRHFNEPRGTRKCLEELAASSVPVATCCIDPGPVAIHPLFQGRKWLVEGSAQIGQLVHRRRLHEVRIEMPGDQPVSLCPPKRVVNTLCEMPSRAPSRS
jgi:hypothetical protein